MEMAEMREKVPRRAYGGTNPHLPESVPIIGLGCSSFSSFFQQTEPDQDQLTAELVSREHPKVHEWIRTIHHAILTCGITLLDTAPWYGHGVSEIVIGYALEQILSKKKGLNEERTYSHDDDSAMTIERGSLVINTKVGRYEADKLKQFDFSHNKTIHSTKLSIERMKCSYIDVLQLHDPEFSPSINILLEETIPAMLKCRDELKIVKALGITGYPLEIQYEILKKCSTCGMNAEGVVFDQSLTYGHFNLHDTSLFTKSMRSITTSLESAHQEDDDDRTTATSTKENSSASSSFASYCKSESIALVAAAPLSMGLLKDTPPPNWHPACDALHSACQNASRICSNITNEAGNDDHVDLAMLATLFALSNKEIGSTLIGMSSVEEVDRAYHAAIRFQKQMNNDKGVDGDIETSLKDILKENEMRALITLRDKVNGPFANVWKDGTYEWDGKREADLFWKDFPGGRVEAEKNMKQRT